MKVKHKVNVMYQGRIMNTILRVLKAEYCGNFNPIFCKYRKKKYLVKSTYGDLSDPFRREESYLNNLYIELED